MITFLDDFWIEFDEDILILGVHESPLSELEPIEKVLLPDVDQSVETDRSFGEIIGENGQINFYTPVDGEIIEVNDIVIESPASLLDDPYGEGFLVRIKAKNPEELTEKHIKSAEEQIVDNE